VAECRVPSAPPGPERLALAKWMIENGSDVHQGGDGPLMRAALNGDRIPMMELLVSHGADVNAQGTAILRLSLRLPRRWIWPASTIERIVKAVEPYSFSRVYGAFWDMVIERDGKAAIKRSADRYIRAIG
jgi:ankyrin repeat protein